VNEVIDRVISRLEQTRTTDLKDLVQILAPNFEAAGFRESVRTLALGYANSMDIDILVDEASENLHVEKLLGAFRIIEQALINSLVHGPAKNVKISLATDALGSSRLEISDDGPGSSDDLDSSGVGTAVIDSWVGIINGSKNIETVPGHGYQLTVEFSS
jgi:signal transduction histidine kinase